MINKYFSFYLVSIKSYEGYWIQKPDEHAIQCYTQNQTNLICNDSSCITNCLSTYQVWNATATFTRDPILIGTYNSIDEIKWANNFTWIRKGNYSNTALNL